MGTFRAQHEIHRRLLAQEVARARGEGAPGLLLCGSVARGTARPTSDLDLRLFWPEARPFEAEERLGLLIERHGHTLARAWEEVEAGGGRLYAWREGHVLHDPHGELARLKTRAVARLAAHHVPEEERRALRHWLRSTLSKLNGAPPDLALFLVHTNTWKLAEALCAVNGCPPPATTLMWERLPTLPRQPSGTWLEALLRGNGESRVETYRRVGAWLVEALDQEPG